MNKSVMGIYLSILKRGNKVASVHSIKNAYTIYLYQTQNHLDLYASSNRVSYSLQPYDCYILSPRKTK